YPGATSFLPSSENSVAQHAGGESALHRVELRCELARLSAEQWHTNPDRRLRDDFRADLPRSHDTPRNIFELDLLKPVFAEPALVLTEARQGRAKHARANRLEKHRISRSSRFFSNQPRTNSNPPAFPQQFSALADESGAIKQVFRAFDDPNRVEAPRRKFKLVRICNAELHAMAEFERSRPPFRHPLLHGTDCDAGHFAIELLRKPDG